MEEFASLPATKLLAAMRAGRMTSVALLDLYQERCRRINPAINALVVTDFERARARAIDADRARAKGEHWGVLHGLPMTVKESIEVAGLPCTSGFAGLSAHVPSRDADVVRALLGAGAIIFGKTNVPQLTMDMQTYNGIYGQTNNPWDTARAPGGSSGGSAAALSAGLTALDIGSDIGGSIRNPSHFCGVFGHKPSSGVVSMRGHVPPFPGTFPDSYVDEGDLAVIGPLARCADDLDLAMDVIAGDNPVHAARPRLAPRRKQRLAEFRVALWLDDPAFPVSSAITGCLQSMADALAAAGADVNEHRPDIDFGQAHEVYTQLLYASQSDGLPDRLFARAKETVQKGCADEGSYRARWARATMMLHRDWKRLNRERLQLRQKWADFFTVYDILLCPVVGTTAFMHDHSNIFERTLVVDDRTRHYLDVLLPWAGLITVASLPSTVVPAGFDTAGLPIGVQVVGPYLDDRTTIHFARLISALDGYGFRPAL